jgi:hypothetical protein
MGDSRPGIVPPTLEGYGSLRRARFVPSGYNVTWPAQALLFGDLNRLPRRFPT